MLVQDPWVPSSALKGPRAGLVPAEVMEDTLLVQNYSSGLSWFCLETIHHETSLSCAPGCIVQ